MEDDASYKLARQIEEEELAQIAAFEALQRAEKENAPFDCPICADTFPRGSQVKIESCGPDCAICRGCLLGHVKAQVEQARWPIFCPTCPNTAPRRGGESL
jgi:Zn finger protein HypA/HybF involved in hydrogenase expression